MPKNGWKSISVPEFVYDRQHEKFTRNREKLYMKGITSFSGYITHMLNNAKEEDQTVV